MQSEAVADRREKRKADQNARKEQRKTDKSRVVDLLISESYETQFFKSRIHEIAFYFSLAVNDTSFDDKLGIKRVHFKDVVKARSLQKAYIDYFHPDKHISSNIDLDFDEVTSNVNNTFTRVSGGKL